MKAVILWIGNYKIGTSLQQVLFFHNAELLREAGIYYPTTTHKMRRTWFPRSIDEAFYQGVARETACAHEWGNVPLFVETRLSGAA